MSGVLRLSNNVTGRSTIIASASNDQTFTLPATGGTLLAGGSSLEVIFPSGTEALPGLHVESDVNTGLYSPTANTLGISTDGTEAMRIDSAGNVGIGTSSPAQLLTLSSAGPRILLTQTSANSNAFLDAATSGVLEFSADDNNVAGSSSMRFKVDGSERLRIDSSGRLLVGTTTEGQTNADNLTLADSGSCGLTLRSATDNFGRIYFSDGTSGDAEYRGIVQYDHTNNRMQFAANASTAMTIDSSGNVGIASTSPDAELHIGGSEPHIDIGPDSGNRAKIGFKSTDIYIGTTSGSGQTIFKNNVTSTDNPADSGTERMRITSDGNVTVGGNTDGATPAWSSVRTAVRIDGAQPILYLNETDVATGSAGSYLGAASTNLYLGNAGGSLIFQTSPPDGSTIERGRFLSTGGLTFNGDTATANALDDYEEGNFNASVTGSTSAGTATYQYALGDYTKVGRMVHVRIYIAWTGHTGTGGLYIRGLPYNIVNYAAYGGPSVNYWNQMNPGPCNGISALWGIGSDYVYFYTNSVSGGAAASVLVQPLGSIIICGSYYVA